MPAAIAAAATGLLAVSLAGEAQAQRASAMIVLDGSNSMNARLPNDRKLKYVTVLDAMVATLAKGTGGTDVGLTTFGARRPNDCSDVDVAAPPAAGGSGVIAALERFQPRGFSPVVAALRAAAKAMPASGKASIVLVLDDLASCRAEDPCKVAAELKQQNPALAIHIVGLALRPQDQPVLACIAKETGGQLINAVDGPGVAPAIERAFQLAGFQEAPALVREPAPVAAERRSVEPAAPAAGGAPGIDETRPGLHLSARLAETGPPLAIPMRWRVWPETAAAEATPLLEAVAPAVSRTLPDGRYVVEVEAGLVTVRRPFEIASQGATPVRVVLNAAMLSLSAPLANGAGPAPGAVLTLGRGRDGQAGGAQEPVWMARTARSDLVVPAGAYTATAADGLARTSRTISVAEGASSAVDLTLGAGRIVIETEDQTPAQILIEADEPETASGRREIHRAVTARLETTLPAGTYLAVLRRGTVESRERFSVRPGETLRRKVAVALARARLVSPGATRMPGIAVGYRIQRLDVPDPPIQRWGGAEFVIDLTPGRYRIEARLGAQNAISIREAELKAGFETRLELDPGAGSVRLKLADAAAGLGLGTVYWQIFDDSGAAVWRTGQAEPVLALTAGRYRVRAETRDKVIERVMEIRSGDSGVIEITE